MWNWPNHPKFVTIGARDQDKNFFYVTIRGVIDTWRPWRNHLLWRTVSLFLKSLMTL